MFRNTRQEWGSTAKSLHWLMVILIAAEVPAGFLMSYTYGLSMRDLKQGLPLHTLASQIHHTLGFCLLLLALMRVIWRLWGVTPDNLGPGYSRRASRVLHAALYACLVAVPLSGWAAVSVFGDAPLWIFDRKGVMPPILPRVPWDDPRGYGYYAKIHILLLIVGAALLAVHFAAAMYHHFMRRDNTLLRMWPLGKPTIEP